MTKLSKVATNGGCFGQPFLKLIPAQKGMKYPRIVNLDPRLVRIVTSPEDCDLHVAYIIEYPGPGSFQKRQIISRVDPDNSAPTIGEEDMNDTWTISNYVRMDQGGSWYLSGTPDPWDYPFAPIFTCQNLPNPNEAWGTPDLTPDLIQMNEALNFLLSTLARIAYFHGHPKQFVSGVQAAQLAVGIGDILCLPSPDSKFGKLDAMTDFNGLLSFIEDLRSSMDEQSRIPAVALGRLKDIVKGTVSGITMKLMFQPLVEKTTLKRRSYGKLVRQTTIAALIVAGILPIEAYEDYQVTLRWNGLLPIDDLNAAQTAVLLQQLGISSHTLISDLGFNPEAEAKKNAEEDAKKLTNYSQGTGLPPTAPAQPPATPSGQPGCTTAGSNSSMSIEWYLYCKTCNNVMDDSINHGANILRSMVKAAPHIKAALDADTSGYLEVGIMAYSRDAIDFAIAHLGHELELHSENYDVVPLVQENVISEREKALEQLVKDWSDFVSTTALSTVTDKDKTFKLWNWNDEWVERHLNLEIRSRQLLSEGKQ